MQRSVIYDVMRDGDRHLRGKIAELIFKRVRSKLLERPCCCNTRELTYFFAEYAHFKEEVSFLLGEKPPSSHFYIMWASTLEKEGWEEVRRTLSEEEVKNLGRFCLLCLKEGEKEVCIHIDDSYRLVYLCSNCLRRCMERRFIRFNGRYEVTPNVERFSYCIRKLSALLDIRRNPGVVAVLSRLDSKARIFLYETYKAISSQYSFDYVCVDEAGNKYLVDVTSVRQVDEKPAELSKKENQIADKAKEAGFKILVPVVRFLEDWQVQVELTET
jgi:hypothetical protein